MQGSSIGCFSRCKSESCYVNVLFMDYTKMSWPRPYRSLSYL
uniref:Uncharacterized protein n=1 Tax=Anguilla anguilla TaxID=7936 RepID=A0A0E9RZJ8_ANGAN